MSLGTELSVDGGTLLVRVPIKRRHRGGRRLMLAADRPETEVPKKAQIPRDPILKALGRAWRWKRLLESMSLTEIAATEKVSKPYLCRLLRLTLLSPTVVESILDGTLRQDVLLVDLSGSVEADWAVQERQFLSSSNAGL